MSINTPSRPMAAFAPTASASSSPSASIIQPAHPTPSRLEQSYNTAVQSFVRRDHVKAHAALAELLGMVRRSVGNGHGEVGKADKDQAAQAWWDLEPNMSFSKPRTNGHSATGADGINGEGEGGEEAVDEEWTIKTLKLYISACASTYADPPSRPESLPPDIRKLLPPAAADKILTHARDTCASLCPSSDIVPNSRVAYSDPLDPDSEPESTALLPPPLVSTLILASLKLPLPALSFAHHTAESWLAALPDHFVLNISSSSPLLRPSTIGFLSADEKKRIESAREGYVRVIELFVGEVLGREEEWEMARGLLDGESVMSSKRKESLYKHLRALRSRPKSKPSSPSNSGILPSPSSSGILPAGSPLVLNGSSSARVSRSRSSSTSSSSSERTARPVSTPHGGPLTPGGAGRKSTVANGSAALKGKSKARALIDDEKHATASTSTASSLPSKIWVNHPTSDSGRRTASGSPSGGKGKWHARSFPESVIASAQQTVSAIYASLPIAAQQRLLLLTRSPWLSVALPLPLIALIVGVITLRRRLARRAGTVSQVTAAAAATSSAGGLEAVRQRIDAVRARGFMQWVWWYLRWWARKFIGVWKLGTTVTYM